MLRTPLLAAAALAAAAATAEAQTEITFWHAMSGALGDAVNDIAAGFNESQSDYRVVPVFKGGYEETLTATIAAFRAGEQPNIVQVFDAGAATIIGAPGAVIPAETLMAENGVEFDPADYIEGVRSFYADAAGTMVGMPFNSSTPILYYNIDALEAAGVEPPETWEAFAEIAPKIKEAGYVPLAQSHLPWIFTENFMSRHNQPFATNANGFEGVEGTELLLSENDAIKAHFAALKEWHDAGLFGWYGTAWGDNQQPFAQGEVAMWIGSSASFGGLRQSMEAPFSATFLPYWEGVEGAGTATFIGGAALFAMTGHPEAEDRAAAAFFEHLASPEVQVKWHKATGYVPITVAAYELARSQGYYEETPSAEVGTKQLQLPAGEWTKGYRMGFYVQIRDVMNREYSRLLNGETTVEEAFETIDREGNQLLERFARTQG